MGSLPPRCRMVLRWVPGGIIRNSPPRGRCDNWGRRIDENHVHVFNGQTIEQINEAWRARCRKHGVLAGIGGHLEEDPNEPGALVLKDDEP